MPLNTLFFTALIGSNKHRVVKISGLQRPMRDGSDKASTTHTHKLGGMIRHLAHAQLSIPPTHTLTFSHAQVHIKDCNDKASQDFLNKLKQGQNR